ncbi:MAG TPA: outer membrane protein assembly factor BamB [Nevskiaceae bacterium]|nr:outer membrane protein assembly factor BamB [Nevskiaceae bacterium]
MKARILLLVLVAFVAACGSKKKSVREPAKLVDISNPAVRPHTDWTASAGDGADGKVSGFRLRVEADAIYAADIEGHVYAFSRTDGRKLWSVETKSRLVGGPSVSGDLVLVGSLNAEVIALRRADGTERWRTALSSEVVSPPVGDGGTVVARSLDGRIYGLSAGTGDRVWTFDRQVPNLVLRGSSAPLVAGNSAIVGMDNGRIASLRLADGQPQWEQAVSVPSGRTELERLTDVDADLIDGPDCLFAASFGGDVACLDLSSGEVMWRRSVKSYTGMAMSDDKLFVTDESGVVWGLDQKSGTAAWKQEAMLYRKLSPPAYFGGYVVVGDYEGYLHWMDPSTGQLVGRSRAGSEPIMAPLVASADQLYVMNVDGRIAAIGLKKK